MKKNHKKQPRHRLLKASCVSAGLLSISNPTQVTAADIGMYDVHNVASLGSVPNPFPNSPMGVHVAVGDLDGDGLGEIVMGPGRGAAEFAVFTTKRNPRHISASAYGITPGAGVSVATGDLDGDGHADIIVTPATGRGSAGAFLKLPDIDGEVEELSVFGDIFDGFSGGVSVAVGDVTDDGLPGDGVLAGRLSCACGRPIKIKIPPLSSLATFEDFGPPAPHGHGGVQVAAADFDRDGVDDILILPNDPPSGIAQPLIAKSKDDHKQWIEVLSFNEPAGVHIAVGDLENDGIPDLVVGSARGTSNTVKWYRIDQSPVLPDTFTAVLAGQFQPYDPSFMGGVRVAVGDINGDGYQDLAFAPASIPEPATIASLLAGFGAWLFGGRRKRRDAAPPG